MATPADPDIDDDFNEIYKEYTGPPCSKVSNHVQDSRVKVSKRSHDSDEEEETRDPNAVPTDFTSREAKVWEAKSKATERNWKKRKEEEMICKICGESGHFTQGCPSTLGANRKSQDFFERVPARDKHVKALFTEKVMQRIEKDIGCKLRMEEKFLIVSGKDRLVLAKGVDAVHKMIKGEDNQKGSSGSHKSRSRSPVRSPVGLRLRRSESQRSNSGHPRDASHYQQRFGRQDKHDDRVREDIHKFARNSPQAYGYDGGRSRSSLSKSPARPPYACNSYGSYDGRNHSMVDYRAERGDMDKRGSDLHSSRHFEFSEFPHTLEELEAEHQRETMELRRVRDKEEEEENYKHHENIREMGEKYMKKLEMLRGTHTRQWEEFVHLDSQRRQQETRISSSDFGGYKHSGYSNYNASSANLHYPATNLPIDSRARYPNQAENYISRPHDTYGEFQRQRREEFEEPYNRY